MLSTYKILVALFLPLSSSSEIGSGIQILEKNNVTLLNAEDIGSGNFEEFNSVKNVGFQEDLENSQNYFSMTNMWADQDASILQYIGRSFSYDLNGQTCEAKYGISKTKEFEEETAEEFDSSSIDFKNEVTELDNDYKEIHENLKQVVAGLKSEIEESASCVSNENIELIVNNEVDAHISKLQEIITKGENVLKNFKNTADFMKNLEDDIESMDGHVHERELKELQQTDKIYDAVCRLDPIFESVLDNKSPGVVFENGDYQYVAKTIVFEDNHHRDHSKWSFSKLNQYNSRDTRSMYSDKWTNPRSRLRHSDFSIFKRNSLFDQEYQGCALMNSELISDDLIVNTGFQRELAGLLRRLDSDLMNQHVDSQSSFISQIPYFSRSSRNTFNILKSTMTNSRFKSKYFNFYYSKRDGVKMNDGSWNKELTDKKLRRNTFWKKIKHSRSIDKVDFQYKYDMIDKAVLGNPNYVLNNNKLFQVDLTKDFGLKPDRAHFFSPICIQKRLKSCKNLVKNSVNLKFEDNESLGQTFNYESINIHIEDLQDKFQKFKE